MPQWSGVSFPGLCHIYSLSSETQLVQRKKKQGMALNDSFIPHPNCAALQCTAMLLFPKSSHSIQLRACFIHSPATAIFLRESRAPGAHLRIQSEQTFPWWGNHSEGVGVVGGCQRKPKSYLECTLRTGNGVGCFSAARPRSWHSGEKEAKWVAEGKEHGTGHKIKLHYWKFHKVNGIRKSTWSGHSSLWGIRDRTDLASKPVLKKTPRQIQKRTGRAIRVSRCLCVPHIVLSMKTLSALKCWITCNGQGESPILPILKGHRRGTTNQIFKK